MSNFITCILLFGLFYANAQYIPIGVGNKKTCKYEFTVPDNAGACSATSAALEKKIDDIKADLDRTRLQYVSQNGIVQGTLSKIQTDTNMYVSKVSDLNAELQKIKQAVNSGQSGGNTGTNQNVNQLIHDTKDLLTKAVGDINGRIFNLTIEFQRNAVEESKVNSAIQNQINSQAVQLATAEQKLLSLENMLKNYKPPTTGTQQPATGPSNAQLSTLQQKFQKLEQDLKSVDSLQQQQFKGLSDKTNKILSKLLNQSHDIDVVSQATNQSVAKLTAAEQMIQTTKADFTKFKTTIDPQVQILSQEASTLLNNLTGVQKQLQQIGAQFLNGQIKTMTNKAEIKKVKKQADDLAIDITKINTQISAQAGELITLKTDLAGIKSPTVTGSGVSVNVNQLVNTIKNQTQADVQKAEAGVKQVQNMVQTLMLQLSTLSGKVNKLSQNNG